jgi:5-methyltetrahydropteroyltriglutamate--homocysteine methyltransferase
MARRWPWTWRPRSNQELKYLVERGLEAIQLIDVLPPYTQDMWQIEVMDRLFDGVDALKLWHICYGSVDGPTDVWEDKSREMMPLFHEANVDAVHIEFSHREFGGIEAFRDFPTDKALGIGVIDAKDTNVEAPEDVADRIRKVLNADIMPPERLLIMPDCGLGYFSRSVASAKLKAMGAGVEMVRAEL